ncbi:MAG TPA: DUF309 domain-containing protein [Verrucomicrobiae bacterium]|nr:DUF309 domain-containing protein [Verrucomicrobiae bacterium]
MSRKGKRIAATIERFREGKLDPYYLGYFDCFNRQLFYEAHEILEVLWLPARQAPEGSFYKGLIQLAGAFVHLQKNRLRPAAALFRLAQANLEGYAPVHAQLDVRRVLALIQDWHDALEQGRFSTNPMALRVAPQLTPPPNAR